MSTPIDKMLFDIPGDLTWIMHCSEGPVPTTALDALREFLSKESRPWTIDWEEGFIGLPGAVRSSAAELFDADPRDFTLASTTSSGLTRIAQGLEWRPGDEVLLPLGEFPANIWPWKALEGRGVVVRQQPLWPGHRAGAEAWQSAPPPPGVDPESALLEAIGPRTRVLAASWVRFQDGLRLDLERLAEGCRRRGAHLVVDGVQGAGTLPVSLGAFAAFATGGHKGLLAPQGLGVLWTNSVFRRELLPTGSWLSVDQALNFSRPSTDVARDWAADGTRLEQGVPNLIGCVCLAESLRILASAGAGTIESHVDRLQAELLGELAGCQRWKQEAQRLEALRSAGRLGSILGLHHGGAGADDLNELLQRGVKQNVYASVREGYMRIAFHGWHDAEDVSRVARWLAS